MHYNLLLQIDRRPAAKSNFGLLERAPQRVEEMHTNNIETAEVQGTAWKWWEIQGKVESLQPTIQKEVRIIFVNISMGFKI